MQRVVLVLVDEVQEDGKYERDWKCRMKCL